MAAEKMTKQKLDLTQSQLFLDDVMIEDCARVTRVWHQPEKLPEPVLKAEHPWEFTCPIIYGSVLHREGKFQMWYLVFVRDPVRSVCYAESEDGIHWHKPKLGLHEVMGSKENNVVLRPEHPGSLLDYFAVIEDPDDEAYPLKAIYWDSGWPWGRKKHGIFAARSIDGLRWEKLGKVLPLWGDRSNVMTVKQDGKFVILGREPEGWSRYGKGRVVSRVESRDLVHWSDPELVLTADIEDPAHMEIYAATASPYESMTLGTIDRFYVSPDKMDTELIFSRDGGHTWQRPRPRPPFISWGSKPSFDDTWVNLPASGPIVRDGRLWFYYSGRAGAHGVTQVQRYGAIGLATLRIDGFCSVQAQERDGYLLTPVIEWPGGDLLVNMDPRRDIGSHPGYGSGQLRVEIRDEANKPIRGWRADDCHLMTHNAARSPGAGLPVRWRKDKSLDRLKNRRVRLHFEMRDTHLYSFKAGVEK